MKTIELIFEAIVVAGPGWIKGAESDPIGKEAVMVGYKCNGGKAACLRTCIWIKAPRKTAILDRMINICIEKNLRFIFEPINNTGKTQMSSLQVSRAAGGLTVYSYIRTAVRLPSFLPN